MVNEKMFWRIREVMDETGLPITTLRFWEKEFPQLNPRKDGHGNRYYSREDIDFIKQILYLRDVRKITRLDAIREALADPTKQVDVRQKSIEILENIRKELVAIRAQI